MVRIITLNVNGIRSAAKKGFFDWLAEQNADIVCLQELKAQENDLQAVLFKPEGYYVYYHCAQKKGYSGVAIYTKKEPNKVITGLGFPHADEEGRYIEIEFTYFSVASVYFPSGTTGEARQAIKYLFLERYAALLKNRPQDKPFILCGDLNIAHRQIDLKNWRANQKNTGFLPAERAWMDQLFGPLGFVDAFRVKNQDPDQYTWWSNRGQAWTKNVGWRIDYQIVSPGLRDYVQKVSIFKAKRFSDHAPLCIEYKINFS